MNYLDLYRMPEGQALIYRIVNKRNGKFYVGSTIEPKRRFHNHFRDLNAGKHHSFILQNAFNVHGSPAFVVEPLLICAEENRHLYENIYIGTANYNVSREAGLPARKNQTGIKRSDETKRRMSVGIKKAKIAGRIKTDTKCEAAWRYYIQGGIKQTEACALGSISYKAFWDWMQRNEVKIKEERECTVAEARRNNKPNQMRVFCTEIQCVFFSRNDAALFFNVWPLSISKVITERRKLKNKYTLENYI